VTASTIATPSVTYTDRVMVFLATCSEKAKSRLEG
jgi:hypothetical protein